MIIGPGLLRGSARASGLLVAPSVLRAPLTLTRAQLAGVQSSATGADGATLALFGADVARFNGTARRLLIEGQRTNAIRNPRAEGAVAGTPGTLPTHWAIPALLGVTRSVIGVGTENGIAYADVRLQGTPNATSFINLRPDSDVAGANGQTWTFAAFVRLVGGSLANTAISIEVREADSGGNFLANTVVAITPTAAALNSQRYRATRTFNNASAALVHQHINAETTNGAAIDITLRIGWPQLEQAAFASSAILPPVGTPGASTRGADLVSASLSSLGIPASGACTVLFSGTLAAVGSGNRRIVTIHDGTFNNATTLLISTSGLAVAARTTAGAFANGSSAGTPVSDTPFRAGIAIDGSGRAAASFNGGAAQAVTGAPTTGLTTLQLGSWLGAEPLFGETLVCRVLPYTLSDTDLAAAVAALPT